MSFSHTRRWHPSRAAWRARWNTVSTSSNVAQWRPPTSTVRRLANNCSGSMRYQRRSWYLNITCQWRSTLIRAHVERDRTGTEVHLRRPRRDRIPEAGGLHRGHRVGEAVGWHQDVEVGVAAHAGVAVHRRAQHRALEHQPWDASGIEHGTDACEHVAHEEVMRRRLADGRRRGDRAHRRRRHRSARARRARSRRRDEPPPAPGGRGSRHPRACSTSSATRSWRLRVACRGGRRDQQFLDRPGLAPPEARHRAGWPSVAMLAIGSRANPTLPTCPTTLAARDGAVAQLVERNNRTVEARGSIPLSSTRQLAVDPPSRVRLRGPNLLLAGLPPLSSAFHGRVSGGSVGCQRVGSSWDTDGRSRRSPERRNSNVHRPDTPRL